MAFRNSIEDERAVCASDDLSDKLQEQELASVDNDFENSNESSSSLITTNNSHTKLIKRIVYGSLALSSIYAALNRGNVTRATNSIERRIPFAATTLITTESLAWAGGGMMLISAGKKIGNPLTASRRLKSIKNEVDSNVLYKAGWTVSALGAIGTSALISIGAITELPTSTWPLAFSAASASIVFSTIPLMPKRKLQREC